VAEHRPNLLGMASLTNDRWRRIEELFARAAECPVADRQRLLAEWCDGDEALRLEVESLLQSSEAADRASDPFGTVFAGSRMVESTGACDVARTDHWIGHTIGAYRLERLIATGGMGAVYLARRVSGDFQQDVAFKLIATRLTAGWVRQRFLFERQTLASLQHPYIARLLDGGITEAGEPYLVMEYIEGQRLDEYCAQTNAPVAEVVKLVLQLCEAVSFVHRNLIVHRDLKPSNVLVTDSGTVKLLDFGAAKLLDPGARPGTELTRMGIRPLTPQYASPEQILGEAVTTSSDIYSLGVILYRLVAGRLPFEDSTLPDAEWIDARLESTPPALSAAMSDMNAVVLKALQPDPKDRYHSVDDLASDLRNLLELRPVAARQGGFVYRASKLVRRRARTVAAVAAIAVACCVAAIATVREGRVAVVQETRATTGYNEMRHLANLLLFDFYDQVRQLQGSTEVQHQLVSEALGFLDKLGHDVADDSSLQLDLVDAYTKMGNVLGKPV
jgi:eukaryotic-like serine/threonine-protein kinase